MTANRTIVEIFETEKKNLSQSDKQPEGSKDAKKTSAWKIQAILQQNGTRTF